MIPVGMHAFLYSNGQMTDLGTLTGAPESVSEACDINNSGQIVGSADDSNGHENAVLFSNGQVFDLNSLIPKDSDWILVEANAINDFEQIVGSCWNEKLYQEHAFLLDPISGLTPTPRDGITVGNISTLGSSIQLQGLKVKFTGSDVSSGNITIEAATVLNSSTGKLTFNSTDKSQSGDITFYNTIDGATAATQSLSLTAGTGSITFNKAIGSGASLIELKVNSAQTVTAKSEITTNSNITLTATQDITTAQLSVDDRLGRLTDSEWKDITQTLRELSYQTVVARDCGRKNFISFSNEANYLAASYALSSRNQEGVQHLRAELSRRSEVHRLVFWETGRKNFKNLANDESIAAGMLAPQNKLLDIINIRYIPHPTIR